MKVAWIDLNERELTIMNVARDDAGASIYTEKTVYCFEHWNVGALLSLLEAQCVETIEIGRDHAMGCQSAP